MFGHSVSTEVAVAPRGKHIDPFHSKDFESQPFHTRAVLCLSIPLWWHNHAKWSSIHYSICLSACQAGNMKVRMSLGILHTKDHRHRRWVRSKLLK